MTTKFCSTMNLNKTKEQIGTMKRGGYIDQVLAIIMIIATLTGTAVILHEGNKIYAGNISEKSAYELPKCKAVIEKIPDSNIIIFESKKEAQDQGYTVIDCI